MAKPVHLITLSGETKPSPYVEIGQGSFTTAYRRQGVRPRGAFEVVLFTRNDLFKEALADASALAGPRPHLPRVVSLGPGLRPVTGGQCMVYGTDFSERISKDLYPVAFKTWEHLREKHQDAVTEVGGGFSGEHKVLLHTIASLRKRSALRTDLETLVEAALNRCLTPCFDIGKYNVGVRRGKLILRDVFCTSW